jgi:hypothetical protein
MKRSFDSRRKQLKLAYFANPYFEYGSRCIVRSFTPIISDKRVCGLLRQEVNNDGKVALGGGVH